MKLDPKSLVVGIEKAISVTSKPMHMSEGTRQPSITHDDGHLMQRFGQLGPEIPVAIGAAKACTWVAFDRVVEVREFERVAQEKHRRVVAHQVPVSFFRVELQGEATNV